MDADIEIMVGTVQTDCKVCDSVTLSFLTHSIRHKSRWCFLSLPLNIVFGERGGASFGAGAGADGRKFQLSHNTNLIITDTNKDYCLLLLVFVNKSPPVGMV